MNNRVKIVHFSVKGNKGKYFFFNMLEKMKEIRVWPVNPPDFSVCPEDRAAQAISYPLSALLYPVNFGAVLSECRYPLSQNDRDTGWPV